MCLLLDVGLCKIHATVEDAPAKDPKMRPRGKTPARPAKANVTPVCPSTRSTSDPPEPDAKKPEAKTVTKLAAVSPPPPTPATKRTCGGLEKRAAAPSQNKISFIQDRFDA